MAGKTQTSGPCGGQGELGEETEVDAHPRDTAGGAAVGFSPQRSQ